MPDVVEQVLIEHTGDPAVYPQCERVMHEPAPAGASHELALRGGTLAACGATIEFCFLGEPRAQTGWNWCPACFPDRKPRSFFREYSLINKARAMVHVERGDIAQQERLLPPRKRKEDEQTKLARLEVANRKIRVDRAALLAERARQVIDRQRVAELAESGAHPEVLAALGMLDRITTEGFEATEADIDDKQDELAREEARKPKRKRKLR